MKRNRLCRIIISTAVWILSLCFVWCAPADTIHLKNGRSLEGVIKREDAKGVELEMAGGAVYINIGDVTNIERSSPEEARKIRQGFEQRKAELEKQENVFYEAREKRFNEYGRWRDEGEKKRSGQTAESKEIQAARDQMSDSIIVEAVINNKVKAVLLVDTGASLVVLSKRIGGELGVDLSDTKREIIELEMANGRRVKAKTVVLKSVNVQGAEEKDVLAAVHLEEEPSIGLHGGLLGMSYLGRFNIKIDRAASKMILERIGKAR